MWANVANDIVHVSFKNCNEMHFYKMWLKLQAQSCQRPFSIKTTGYYSKSSAGDAEKVLHDSHRAVVYTGIKLP